MSFTIQNSQTGQSFPSDGATSILDAALSAGRAFPYSCRGGSCGTCKAKLISGEIDAGPFGETALSAAEKSAGYILLCQAKAQSDLEIDARELASGPPIPIRTLPCRVVQITHLSHDVIELSLKLPQNQSLEYLAGQYIDILLRDGRRRSFSIANTPDPEAGITLHIRRVPNGRFTGHVFDGLRERDLLRFQGPFGTFFLDEKSERPAVLMAGGTGLAPIKAMLQSAFQQKDERPFHLFWGVRSQQDLYQHSQLQAWSEKHRNLIYTPVLSEPQTAIPWDGETGWVHEAVLRRFPDLSNVALYTSGPPPMIAAAKPVFFQHGLSDEHFFYDSFEFGADTLQ